MNVGPIVGAGVAVGATLIVGNNVGCSVGAVEGCSEIVGAIVCVFGRRREKKSNKAPTVYTFLHSPGARAS